MVIQLRQKMLEMIIQLTASCTKYFSIPSRDHVVQIVSEGTKKSKMLSSDEEGCTGQSWIRARRGWVNFTCQMLQFSLTTLMAS